MSTTTINFKGLGFELSVSVPQNATCSEAIAAFERITSKSLSGMDLYDGARKITDLEKEVAPKEITAVKSKHASASEATTIQFKGLGFDLGVSVPEGASCQDAIKVFESITSKVLAGMDLYDGTTKITDLTQEAPKEITAVKSKHASASETTINFKGLGFELNVSVPAGASCTEAVAVFERITSKSLAGMDLYDGSKKITDLTTEAPKEITTVKSKHASAL